MGGKDWLGWSHIKILAGSTTVEWNFQSAFNIFHELFMCRESAGREKMALIPTTKLKSFSSMEFQTVYHEKLFPLFRQTRVNQKLISLHAYQNYANAANG